MNVRWHSTGTHVQQHGSVVHELDVVCNSKHLHTFDLPTEVPQLDHMINDTRENIYCSSILRAVPDRIAFFFYTYRYYKYQHTCIYIKKDSASYHMHINQINCYIYIYIYDYRVWSFIFTNQFCCRCQMLFPCHKKTVVSIEHATSTNKTWHELIIIN